jgi:oligopeptide transport system substrate-binding protein
VHESIEILRERHRDVPLTAEGLWAYDPQWTKPDYYHKGYPGLIGNGPYVLKNWQFKQRIRLEANPHYWNAAAVRSRSIEIVDIEYGNTAFMVYNQGYVDMMTDVSMDYTPNLIQAQREGRRNDIHPIPCFGTYEYTFNCRPKLPDGRPNPLHDARVRRALAMAVDKRDLIDNAFPRLSNPVATTFVPPGSIPGYKSPAGLPYDPERARAELAAAGYPGGKNFPVLPLLYNTGFQHEVGAQAIKRMWARELGITVDLVGKETKTFAEDKIAGRFAIARGGWFGDYNDPTT